MRNSKLVPNALLAPRYGVTDATIKRWRLKASLNFPKPAAHINGRDYFSEDELEAWEASQQRQRPAA
jgi:hypothetical protein